MLDIGLALFIYKSHLPTNWLPKDGLRSLFPPGYSGSISPLKTYVFSRYCTLATNGYGSGPYCAGRFWLMADGQGRWFFGWIYGDSYVPDGYIRQAGFVIKSSIDSQVYGHVDRTSPQVLTRSCSAGTDEVIAKNWPQMFLTKPHALDAPETSVQGVRVFFQLGSSPDPSQVWTGNGYVNLESNPLAGSNVVPDGEGSGSSLFPFPTITADCHVAAIISGAVAGSLKADTPFAADTDVVKQKVASSSSPSSPTAASILEFLKTSMCGQVISDAQVIATRIFNHLQGVERSSAAGAGQLSNLVTTYQLLAAGTAAYKALASSVPDPVHMWDVIIHNNTSPPEQIFPPPLPPNASWMDRVFNAILELVGDPEFFTPTPMPDPWGDPEPPPNSTLVPVSSLAGEGDGGWDGGGDGDGDGDVILA